MGAHSGADCPKGCSAPFQSVPNLRNSECLPPLSASLGAVAAPCTDRELLEGQKLRVARSGSHCPGCRGHRAPGSALLGCTPGCVLRLREVNRSPGMKSGLLPARLPSPARVASGCDCHFSTRLRLEAKSVWGGKSAPCRYAAPSPPQQLDGVGGLVVWHAQGGTSSHSERTEKKSWGLQVLDPSLIRCS